MTINKFCKKNLSAELTFFFGNNSMKKSKFPCSSLKILSCYMGDIVVSIEISLQQSKNTCSCHTGDIVVSIFWVSLKQHRLMLIYYPLSIRDFYLTIVLKSNL